MTDLNTHGYRMESGRHKGELITRVPIQYLQWMVNAKHSEASYAKAELTRRGTVTPTLDISGHAINRASLKCLDIWQRTKNPDEGLHAWLVRMATGAIAHGAPREEKIAYGGMLFVFETDGVWPVLKTVMRDK
jgi:hypothetical protein